MASSCHDTLALMPVPAHRLSKADTTWAEKDAQTLRQSFWRGGVLGLCLTVLTACGGGKGADSNASTTYLTDGRMVSAAMIPNSDADAYRFLRQATFGPTPEDAARVKAIGYDNWIDEQFDMHLLVTHLQMVDAEVDALHHDSAAFGHVSISWWTHAVKDPAQLRQRVAFALSEIFVVSTVGVEQGRRVASYLDMLTDKADANYRDLLEAVALHPAMGLYLSHMSNLKEDPTTGRVPDENFAREIMQLFSIGLYELDDSANPVLINGQAQETYTAEDIKGLAKVFTGFSWYWPASMSSAQAGQCFWRLQPCYDVSQDTTSMTGYADAHSTSAKQFLGTTIPAQTIGAPASSLRIALDRLASHHNTAPFISKQLIQRLVTSNPSDAYVADITRVFRATNGNLRSVVKAILLHDEARRPTAEQRYTYGKLREPVLRMTHLMRAIPHSSYSYSAEADKGKVPFYLSDDTSDIGTSLGQSPMRSPSVFNFFRPGYKPPQTEIANANKVAPEMQITNETSVLSYANYMTNVLQWGWGFWNAQHGLPDIQFDLSTWDSKAASASDLVTTLSVQLLGQTLPQNSHNEAVEAIQSMPSSTEIQRKKRTQAAILMILVSPEFIIQQ